MLNNYYYPYVNIYITIKLLKQNIKYIKHLNYYYKDLINLDNNLDDILKLENIINDINKLPSIIKKPSFKYINKGIIKSSLFKTIGRKDTFDYMTVYLYDNNSVLLETNKSNTLEIIFNNLIDNKEYFINGTHTGKELGTSILSDNIYFNTYNKGS